MSAKNNFIFTMLEKGCPWKNTLFLDVDFSYCWLNLEVKLYSLEQYIGLIEDKLSSTTVDFFRSEGYLETKCLYWNREPKKC